MIWRYYWLAFVLLIVGCASTSTAPVDDRSARGIASLVASDYIVRRGDTLYSIAFRYGLDFKVLAKMNSIGAPYTIVPGQRLIVQREGIVRTEEVGSGAPVIQLSAASPLSGTSNASRQSIRAKKTPQNVTGHVPASAISDASSQRTQKPTVSTAKSTLEKKSSSKSAIPQKSSAKSQNALKTTKNQTTSTHRSVIKASNISLKWNWPHTGTVVRKFSTKNNGNKGLNIRGRLGDAVKAAADGQVVYAGANLRGYGNLIIVNHNEKYLSAYGHNRKILVKEGDKVKAGALIAEMGNSGADATMLHFEIRRNGVPVDPAAYLPKR
ncbi:MAG: peptidoglycan DD-metalloendopeptidase family protein [Pontibacterium sp.]